MKRPFITFVVIVALMIVSGLIGWYEARSAQENVHIDTVRTEVVDTIPYYEPVAKDSAVVRYISKILPSVNAGKNVSEMHDESGTNGESGVYGDSAVNDSAAVTVPITQKKYETEDYRAYVSGYEAQLDSIFVKRKTVNESVVVTRQHTQQKRISVGIVAGAGYGIRSKQGDFFVGVGISYRLF
jgi:hypothetical protein